MDLEDVGSVFSSSASTPSPPSPFKPKFKLRFSSPLTKDGDVVTYTIKITCSEGFEEHVIKRQYEDFEYLDHCLTTSVNLNGIIVPPLPSKPAVTAQMVEAQSKNQFCNNCRGVRGDGFHKDYKAMEMYLNFLLSHNTFGNNTQLLDFLTKEQPPSRTKVKKGFLTSISNRIDSWKSSHKDCEEFFQKEKEWVTEYGLQLNKFNENLSKMIYGKQKLCNALGQLCTDFVTSVGSGDVYGGVIHRLMGRVAEGLNDLKQSIEVQVHNDEFILVSTFDYYSSFIESEKEMLLRRTVLLMDYENCNKALDKAKNDKYEMLQNSKRASEKSFEECSDVARREIKIFQRQRVNVLEETLKMYAQAQLKVACDTYAILANSLNMLEQLHLFN